MVYINSRKINYTNIKFDIDMIIKNIKRIFMVKISQLFVFVLFTYIFYTIPNPAYAGKPLKYTEDTRLQTFISELKPSIYIIKGKPVVYGNNDPLTLFVNADDISILYNKQTEFASVELIQVRVQTIEDENVKIDRARLGAFTSLKYILFVYEYSVCGGSEDESCLESKTSGSVINPPPIQEDSVRTFYQLCIPQ